MRERFIEFQTELRAMDLYEYTEDELKEWFKEWNSYVRKGGVRPGRPA